MAALALGMVAPALRAQQEPAEEADPLAVDDEIVQAVLDTEPSSPSELVRAAGVLADLHRGPAARALLKRLLQSAPDEEALSLLAEESGSATFIRMSTAPDLQPEGREFAEQVLEASRARARDPARIAAAIEMIDARGYAERRAAQRQIRSAGTAAVATAIAMLADDGRRRQHDVAKRALVLLGPQAIDPLAAALEAPEPTLKQNVIEALSGIGDVKAAAYLLAPAAENADDESLAPMARKALQRLLGRVPSTIESFEFLLHSASALYERPLEDEPPAEQQTAQIWKWDSTRRTVIEQTVDQRLADLDRCARLAHGACLLNPTSYEARRLYLLARLESAIRRERRNESLPTGPGTAWRDAMGFGTDAINDILEYALNNGHPLAGVAAARLLGATGDEAVLRSAGSQPSPLVRALTHTDDHLRFASLEAVMALGPDGPFPGSSYVPRALEYFASGRGTPLALVAERRADEARRLAHLLEESGYEVEISTDGRELTRKAKTAADVEIVLLGMTLDRPTVAETLAELRRDMRTAALPVGLIATLDGFERAARMARRRRLTWALVRPHDAEGIALVTRPLEVAQRDLPSRDQRKQYAAKSLRWLVELTKDARQPFELRPLGSTLIAALYAPELRGPAIAALSHTGTPEAQRALVELASRIAQPIETRRAAAGAVGESVLRYGILLSTKEILRQYDRYNQSETEDRETQEVLGSILDALEERTFATTGGSSVPRSPPPREELR